MRKFILNFLLLLSGIAVIYVAYCLTGILHIVQLKLIQIKSDVGILQLLLMIARFLISPAKNIIPAFLGVFGLYKITSIFLNLQMTYKSKHIMSFSIFILLSLIFILLVGFSPDPILFLQFKFKDALLNCDIKRYIELFDVAGIKEFINIILKYLFEFIFHIILILILIWSSFFAAHKLLDYYGYYYQ